MTQAPTSRDVARVAGVSQSTVSNVLGGKQSVAETTRARVMAAIQELAYHPNSGARALKSQRSQVIGLVFPVRELPEEMHFLASVAAACRERGYDGLVVTADEGASGLRRVAGTALCDGLLVMGVAPDDARADMAASLPIPVLFIGVPQVRARVPCVDQNYEAAGAGCADKLAEAGHRHAFVLDPPSLYSDSLNFVGRFSRSLLSRATEIGMSITHVPADMTLLGLDAALARMRERWVGNDALIVSPPYSLAEILSLLSLRGVRAGTDVSVIGTASALADWPISGIDPTCFDIRDGDTVHRAVDRLVQLIKGDPAAATAPQVELVAPRYHAGATLITRRP